MAISIPILLGLFTVLIIYVFTRRLRSNSAEKCHRLPPGPRGWPIVGNLPSFALSGLEQHEVINEWAKKYGDVLTFTVFGTRFVILNEVSLIQETFQSADINDMAPLPPCNKALGRPNMDGIGIITASEGPFWKEQRKFIITVLREMRLGTTPLEDMVGAEASRLLEELTKHDGQFFDPVVDINIAVANIITRIVTGKTYNYDDREFIDLTKFGMDVFDYMGVGSFFSSIPFLASLPLPVNRKGDVAVRRMFDFIAKSVKEHRGSFNPSDEPKDLIGYFLKEQHARLGKGNLGSFDDQHLIQTTWDILISGWETINTSISWYLLILAQHPNIQVRIQEEIDRVVGHDRFPILADRSRLPFTEATMVECYRLSRLVPAQIPHRTRCDVTIAGYNIPKGTYVASNAHYLCSSPDLWKNPDDFYPDRFIDDSGSFDRKLEDSLVEFGIGRRACPGEQLARTELFTFFTYIFQRFTVELPEGAPRTMAGKGGLTYNPLPYQIRVVMRGEKAGTMPR